jgi:hypothetical protein
MAVMESILIQMPTVYYFNRQGKGTRLTGAVDPGEKEK